MTVQLDKPQSRRHGLNPARGVNLRRDDRINKLYISYMSMSFVRGCWELRVQDLLFPMFLP